MVSDALEKAGHKVWTKLLDRTARLIISGCELGPTVTCDRQKHPCKTTLPVKPIHMQATFLALAPQE